MKNGQFLCTQFCERWDVVSVDILCENVVIDNNQAIYLEIQILRTIFVAFKVFERKNIMNRRMCFAGKGIAGKAVGNL